MPPPAVKTYRDLVYYEWAKAIARSAGMKNNFPFIIDRMTKLRGGDLQMSEIVREDRLMAADGRKECAYCGATERLTWDHLIPRARGGPDTISNQVPACATCNSSKGDRDAVEWFRSRMGVQIPRLVWGKYLKLTLEVWKSEGKLDAPLSKEDKARWSGLRVE
jgi:5-methylcytosine-specific restriction endonuclease McrA